MKDWISKIAYYKDESIVLMSLCQAHPYFLPSQESYQSIILSFGWLAYF